MTITHLVIVNKLYLSIEKRKITYFLKKDSQV